MWHVLGAQFYLFILLWTISLYLLGGLFLILLYAPLFPFNAFILEYASSDIKISLIINNNQLLSGCSGASVFLRFGWLPVSSMPDLWLDLVLF